METAIDKGSFNTVFDEHHAILIKHAKLEQPALIAIPNLFSSPHTHSPLLSRPIVNHKVALYLSLYST
jgi:hypothetical protein